MKLENNMAIGSQNEFDEYIVINFILAMKKYNKNLKQNRTIYFRYKKPACKIFQGGNN